MKKENKFIQGVIVGALVGGALTLLDKDTREIMSENARSCSKKVKKIVQNPDALVKQVKQATQQIRNTIEQVTDDVTFITKKVEEIKEISPQVSNVLKETKEAFSNIDSDKNEAN